jgi:hypothetical protein
MRRRPWRRLAALSSLAKRLRSRSGLGQCSVAASRAATRAAWSSSQTYEVMSEGIMLPPYLSGPRTLRARAGYGFWNPVLRRLCVALSASRLTFSSARAATGFNR